MSGGAAEQGPDQALAEQLGLELPGYRLVRMVAQSARFEVYEAFSEVRSAPVVIKLARPSAGEVCRERILREGRCLQGLRHPYLVTMYEFIEAPQPAVVLEVLTGPTLGRLFEQFGPLPVPDTIVMSRQIASVLWYLHGQGLLHCDLKPENVIAEGRMAKLIDFSGACPPGVYKHRHGTPRYLAPEQANYEHVDAPTDVWGLGMLMVEALADRNAYPPGCPEYLDDHGPLASPPAWTRRKAPAELLELAGACTAFDPAQRPPLPRVIEVLDRLIATPPR